jgi:quinol monooxygenase YgiN
MLIQSIHFTFAPEDADKAEGLLRELRDASRKEDGVIGFDVGRSKEEPTVFALWEQYRDKAALESHIATEHFQRLVVHGVRIMAKQRIAETVFPIS